MPVADAALIRTAMIDPNRAPGDLISTAENEGTEDALLYRIRYPGASRLSGRVANHLLVVNVAAAVPAECRIGSAESNHVSDTGNVVIIPAGVAFKAKIQDETEHIVVSLPPARLALASAQSMLRIGTIRPQLRGRDPQLVSILREMVYSAGPASADHLNWHSLVDELVDRMCGACYTHSNYCQAGVLPPDVLGRLNDYMSSRLDRLLLINDLAQVAGQSLWHFSRVFRRTTGMSPHQYVMRLRLQRARAYIMRRLPIAEVASSTGFADQSHLNLWMRRIYGTTPGRLAAGVPRPTERRMGCATKGPGTRPWL